MFKSGKGVTTVYDKDYAADRTFQLYDVDEIVGVLADLGMDVIPAEANGLGGIMFFTDTKPMEHCVFYARKVRHARKNCQPGLLNGTLPKIGDY